MASTTSFPGGINVPGRGNFGDNTVTAGSVDLSSDSLGNTGGLRNRETYTYKTTGGVSASFEVPIGIVSHKGTLLSVKATSLVAATTASLSIQAYKGTTALLTSPVVLDNTVAAGAVVAGSHTSPAVAEGDVIKLVGTVASGYDGSEVIIEVAILSDLT